MDYLKEWEYAVPKGWLNTEWWYTLRVSVTRFAIEWSSIEEPFTILQVKEKWGQLRIYAVFTYDAWEAWERLIEPYEEISGRTCMRCGSIKEEDHERQEIGGCVNCIGKEVS